MTRVEARAMLEEWFWECVRSNGDNIKRAALMERILDAMTGEESTQPLAGNAT